METVKVDSKKRVVLPQAKPGQVLACELSGNAFILTPVEPVKKEVPIVKLVKGTDGLYSLPTGMTLSRETLRAAIRADRDAQ